MAVGHVELLVEEPSMEQALRLLLPKILSDTSFQIYSYQCKNELLQRLPQRLQGYANWLPDNWRIVILVDRDDDQCDVLKSNLEQTATSAGLRTRTTASCARYQVLNRLVIEELEAWYFGDWLAVQAAYPATAANIPRQARYRNSDAVPGGTCQAFERILKRSGYFKGGLRKVEAARAIGAHMEPQRNRSRSFQVLRIALREMVESC